MHTRRTETDLGTIAQFRRFIHLNVRSPLCKCVWRFILDIVSASVYPPRLCATRGQPSIFSERLSSHASICLTALQKEKHARGADNQIRQKPVP